MKIWEYDAKIYENKEKYNDNDISPPLITSTSLNLRRKMGEEDDIYIL